MAFLHDPRGSNRNNGNEPIRDDDPIETACTAKSSRGVSLVSILIILTLYSLYSYPLFRRSSISGDRVCARLESDYLHSITYINIIVLSKVNSQSSYRLIYFFLIIFKTIFFTPLLENPCGVVFMGNPPSKYSRRKL